MIEKNAELKIKAIKDGTVVDHIPANKALHILKILGLPDDEGTNVSIAMNVLSDELGKKDILKIENRELISDELNQLALIAPKATINIIRNYKTIKKDKIILPDTINSIIECTNYKCISHLKNEPLTPKFNVINKYPPIVRCHYCDKLIQTEEIYKQFE